MSAAAAVPGTVDERRGRASLLLLYPVLALFAFPVLGHLLFGQDGYAFELDVFDLPRTGLGLDWVAQGFPLWNPYLTAGNSLFAQQSNTPLGFDVPIAWIAGPFWGYVALTWAMPAVAGIGMHLFLRDSLKLAPLAVVAGAVVYLFGFWHWIYGLAAPALPLLLWLMDRALEPGPRRWRYATASIVVTAFVLYNGLSQAVLLLGGFQLAYLLVAARDLRDGARRVGAWAGTWALALALFAPLVTTQLVMLPISNRAYWGIGDLAAAGLVDRLETIVTAYGSVLAGVPGIGTLGASPGRYGTFFLGGIALPLAVLGIVAGKRDRRRVFLMASLLLIPAWDLLVFVLTPVLEQLGFLRSFQIDRLRHAYPFVLAANAAVGLDVLATTVFRGQPLPSLGRIRLAAVGAAVVPLLAGFVVAMVKVVSMRRAILRQDELALGWLLLAGALAVGLVAAGVIAWTCLRGRPERIAARARTLGLALVLVLAGERAMYAWGERMVDVPQWHGTWAETLGDTPAKRFLAEQPGIDVDRVLSFGGRANQAALAGMLQVDGYQSLFPETYHRLFGQLIAPALVGDKLHTDYYWLWGNRTITFGPEVDPELVALTGARWLLVLDGSTPTVPGIVERFRDPSGTVYEVPDLVPRTFVAAGVDVATDDDALLAAVGEADLDTLRATAFVPAGPEATALVAGLPGGAASTPAGTATIAEYRADRVVVDVAAAGPGILVLTDVMAPGWVADVDGVRTPIATVDVAFRGVPVGAATRQVVFRYEPGFTYLGFAIAAIAAVVTALLAIVVRRRDRGAAAADPSARSAPS